MKQTLEFTLYGHASVLISCGDTSVLTDPWFKNTGNNGTFFAFPPVKVPTPTDIEKISAIQISHNHSDHFCRESLALFSRDIPILITQYLDQGFVKQIADLGFTNIIQIPPGFDGISFGTLQLYQIPLPGSFAYDSALVVRANEEYFYLNNDSVFATRMYSFLKGVFGPFKGCFLGYSPFSVHPIAYDYTDCTNLKLEKPNELILKNYKQTYWDHVAVVCRELKPEWVVPYACGVRFVKEDMLLFNEMFNDPYDVFKQDLGRTKAIVMWPEDKIGADGNLQSQSQLTQQPKISSEIVQPAVTKLLNESAVQDDKIFFQLALLGLISHESKKWLSPMKIKFSVLTTGKPLDVSFAFDGKNVISTDAEGEDYDLKISYPSGPLYEAFSGRINIARVHHSYAKYFSVKVKKIVYGQQEVQSWGRGWKL